MKMWTDKLIKKHIEAIIEESYVLLLTEPEIINYLRNFIKSCVSILCEKIKTKGDVKINKIKIAFLWAQLMLTENTIEILKKKTTGSQPTSRHYVLAEQGVGVKRLILKLIEEINPKLAEDVLEENRKKYCT